MPGEPTQELFDPEIAALLDRERKAPFVGGGADRRAAMLRRLEHAAIAMGAGAAGAALLTDAHGIAAGKIASAVEPVKRAARWGFAAKMAAASAIFVAGGAVGSFVSWHRAPAAAPGAVIGAPPSFVEERAVPLTAEVHPNDPGIPTVSADSLPRVAPSPAVRTSAPPAASPSASTRTTSLAEEQRLLDTARAAVARRVFGAAFIPLDEHERRYRDGKLAEERELLYVQALAGLGKTDEARARAAAFAEKFPGSIFLPAVRAASSTTEP